MTTPSGTITFGNVNTELGRSSTAQLSLNEGSATVLGPRFLAAKFSGAITMNDLRNQTLMTRTGGSTTVTGSCFIPGGESDCIATTSSASIGTIAGGNPGYTYSWELVSGTTFSVDSPTSSSTTFTQAVFDGGGPVTAVYRGVATDSLGRKVFGPNCNVSVSQS
jgi:hypothetical protein